MEIIESSLHYCPILYIGCWLPTTRVYIIHSNLVNFNVKYLKNHRIGYPTCISFLKISPRWVDLNNKNDLLCIIQERTRHETKPTIFGVPSCTLLENKFIFCLNDRSFYALSTKSNYYLKCLYFLWTQLLRIMPETITNRYFIYYFGEILTRAKHYKNLI